MTYLGFAFIQFEQPSSAANAIISENESFLAGQRILVKAAEVKGQKHKLAIDEIQVANDEPMKKSGCNTFKRNFRLCQLYFSETNKYSILNMPRSEFNEVNHCEIIVISESLM